MHESPRLIVSLSFVLALGCSGSSLEVEEATDGSVDDTAVIADTRGVDSTAGESALTDGDPAETGEGDSRVDDAAVCDRASFPTFVRGCDSDENCSFGFHVTDCCGNLLAIGFNHSERSRFDTAEAAYRVACPAACACPMGPIATDSGVTTLAKSKVKVSCVAGSCQTTASP